MKIILIGIIIYLGLLTSNINELDNKVDKTIGDIRHDIIDLLSAIKNAYKEDDANEEEHKDV